MTRPASADGNQDILTGTGALIFGGANPSTAHKLLVLAHNGYVIRYSMSSYSSSRHARTLRARTGAGINAQQNWRMHQVITGLLVQWQRNLPTFSTADLTPSSSR